MEYHSDRFEDFSLLVKKENDIVAVLPANKVGSMIHSHQGLTYGGLLLLRKQKTTAILEIFREILQYLNTKNIEKLTIKQLPAFYAQQPSEELEYLLHLTAATCTRVDASSVIDYRNKLPIQSNRLEGVKKAIKKGLVIKEEPVFDVYWTKILEPNLEYKYQAKPTHSATEIASLHNNFPKNIRQFNVYNDEKLVGGATIFETKTTAHVQYISGNEHKQELGTLDFLFHQLITETFLQKRYFDFGISNENQGKQLNAGLSYWKECFGARTFVQRHYEVKTASHSLLNDVLI